VSRVPGPPGLRLHGPDDAGTLLVCQPGQRRAACCPACKLDAIKLRLLTLALCRPQRPVPGDSVWQFLLAYSLCPAAQYLLGPRRYASLRVAPVAAARCLMMHASLGVGIGLGPLPPGRFWTGFLWRLLLATLAVTQ
jgi:hypothetical protein